LCIAKLWQREIHNTFCFENLVEGDHMEDLSIDRKVVLKFMFEKRELNLWIVFNLLWVSPNGRVL
jgi:hypothetical protein